MSRSVFEKLPRSFTWLKNGLLQRLVILENGKEGAKA